ncbi:MAG: 6-bladed beta-propeller [Treponema sp.]|nr:6-bladed beta-propeller [Treponema sp.]
MKFFLRLIPVLSFIFSFSLYAQNQPGEALRSPVTGGTGPAALSAAEEFRLGVHAYNRFAYNEAILSFERALSFRPAEALILDWLGKAYYRSGFEETAIRQWRAALDIYGRSTGAGMLLGSRIETVANRRYLLPIADDGVRYILAGRYPGKYEDTVLYRQPTSVLGNSDGSAWIVAYGSNEIVRVDVNGIIKDRKRGPLNGFDRPYDLIRGQDGRLYLSEYRGGRISVLDSQGNWLSYIGSRGRNSGQLIGPQNLAVDEDGYLYVVEYGNMRISKFDPDGNFILSFGIRNPAFPGFRSPTGIAAGNGRIYAADNASRAVFMFDPNGNYLGRLAVSGLRGPESLRFLPDGTMLAADANRVLQIDPGAATVRELGLAGNEKTRLVCADMDRNGNLLAADFNTGEVAVMTRFDDLASGLFVQIRNVYTERFPNITVELTVEDRLRRPIQGLDSNNFLLTEDGAAVLNQVFLLPGFMRSGADISLLAERSEKTVNMRDAFAAASRDIASALREMENTKIVSVVSAAVSPRREQHELSLENALRGQSDAYSSRWRFDLALRLAASDLLNASARRSVVYIGSGNTGDLAFEQYSLSELAAYLANNGIVFNAIITGDQQASAAIEYLCRETGGDAMHLYRPQGIGSLVKSTAVIPTGSYSFNYTSRLPTDFGRAWLPLEVEAYLMERSGRDNTGYFPPLE